MLVLRLFTCVFILAGFSARASADGHVKTALIMMTKTKEMPLFGPLNENVLHSFLSQTVANSSTEEAGVQIIDETLYLAGFIDFGDLRSSNLIKDAVGRYSDEIDLLILYTVNQTIDVDRQFELARITYQIDIEITRVSTNTLLASQSYNLTSPPNADLSDVCAYKTTAAEICRAEDLKSKLVRIESSFSSMAQASISSGT